MGESNNLAQRQQDFEFLERRAALAVEFCRYVPRDPEVTPHAYRAIVEFLTYEVVENGE